MEDIKYIKINDHRIAYRHLGEGAPVFLIHGVASHSFLWKEIAIALSENYEVFVSDLLGCGASDKPVGVDYSIAVQADILTTMIRELGLSGVHLVGHDIGGGVAQLMAVNNEELFHDLTLINPVGYDYWPVQPITLMRLPIVRSLTASMMNPHMFRIILRRTMYYKERLDDALFDQFWQPLKDSEGKAGFVQLIKCINNQLLLDITDQLKKLQLPTLLVRGDADAYLSSIITQRLREDIPNSRLERISTGGHFIQLDEPERVSSLLSEFFVGNQS